MTYRFYPLHAGESISSSEETYRTKAEIRERLIAYHSGDWQGEMEIDEAYPTREEILQNPDIDKVAESEEYTGSKPSTIRPATKASIPSNSVASFNADSGNGAIELKVSPKLPGEAASQAKPISQSAGTLAGPARDTFVVFQLHKPENKAAPVPFQLTPDGTFGVVVPSEALASAHRFFGTGQNYAYQLEDNDYPVQAVGTFASSDEARRLYPGLSESWYTLSPYEIMNLGSGPWLKSSSAGSAKNGKKARTQ